MACSKGFRQLFDTFCFLFDSWARRQDGRSLTRIYPLHRRCSPTSRWSWALSRDFLFYFYSGFNPDGLSGAAKIPIRNERTRTCWMKFVRGKQAATTRMRRSKKWDHLSRAHSLHNREAAERICTLNYYCCWTFPCISLTLKTDDQSIPKDKRVFYFFASVPRTQNDHSFRGLCSGFMDR